MSKTLKARLQELKKDLAVAESGVYDWAESERIYCEMVEVDNAINAAEMTDKQLLAGWPNGPASARRAIEAERVRRKQRGRRDSKGYNAEYDRVSAIVTHPTTTTTEVLG